MRYLKLLVLLSCSSLLMSQSIIAEQSNPSESTSKTQKTEKLYRVVDKNGNISYSDTPTPGAEEIVMDEVPSIKLKTPKIEFEDPEERSEASRSSADGHYTTLKFLSLEQDGVIRNNGGIAKMTANLEPDLARSHFLKFYIDGKPISGQQKALTVTAEKVEYGPHTASFKVVTANGEVVQESDKVNFSLLHVVRKRAANKNNPANDLLNSKAFKSNLPQHPKVPSYESMKQNDKTDK